MATVERTLKFAASADARRFNVARFDPGLPPFSRRFKPPARSLHEVVSDQEEDDEEERRKRAEEDEEAARLRKKGGPRDEHAFRKRDAAPAPSDVSWVIEDAVGGTGYVGKMQRGGEALVRGSRVVVRDAGSVHARRSGKLVRPGKKNAQVLFDGETMPQHLRTDQLSVAHQRSQYVVMMARKDSQDVLVMPVDNWFRFDSQTKKKGAERRMQARREGTVFEREGGAAGGAPKQRALDQKLAKIFKPESGEGSGGEAAAAVAAPSGSRQDDSDADDGMEFDAANSDDDADGRVGNVGKRESESEGENRAVDQASQQGKGRLGRNFGEDGSDMEGDGAQGGDESGSDSETGLRSYNKIDANTWASGSDASGGSDLSADELAEVSVDEDEEPQPTQGTKRQREEPSSSEADKKKKKKKKLTINTKPKPPKPKADDGIPLEAAAIVAYLQRKRVTMKEFLNAFDKQGKAALKVRTAIHRCPR